MRIAILSYEYPPETGFGGIGTYSYYQAHALARLGHDVHVFAGSQSPQRRTYRDGNVTVTRWRSVGFIERMIPGADRMGLHWAKNRLQTAANSIAALRGELRHGRFDVVEMPECGGEGALLNHLFDLPTVVRLHSPAELIMPTYPTNGPDRMLTALVERLGISGARTITACSHWVADEVRNRMGIDRPISVIPNGIDLSLFDQDEGIDANQRFGIPRDRLRIFFANRLEERKGIHVVREVMEPVLRKHPNAMFVLAGADPSDVVGRELKPLLAARGLEGGLMHLGKLTLPEVRACLKQSDVFMLPSIWENAPYSLLEAMSAGKPVVASGCGGVPEILRHEIDGIVAPTNDAAAFARGLDRLLSDEKLRLRLGHSARSRVEARYTDEHVARRSLEVYEWALGARQGVAPHARSSSSVALGPGNWFQAWWLRNSTSHERPAFDPAFREVGLAELDFAHAVSARLWWSGPARGGVAETDYLDDLATTHRLRAIDAQRDGSEPEPTRSLALPSTTHPLFEDRSTADAFLDEMWRLGDHPSLVAWMLREVGAADFADRASRNVSLRRLALDAFRRKPCESTHDPLRRIYRNPETAEQVVAKDLEFVANHRKGKEFAALLERYGIHAPLRRTPVFAAERRKKAGKKKRASGAVTVLIPSYRHEAYVRAAIESALRQTHADVRVLVVDDASPDGTVAAARSIADERLEVRANAINLGLGGSIRAALATVTTPYVALLNSDDVFHPERLERCVAELESHPGAQIVATGIGVMDQQANLLTKETSCALDIGMAAHDWVRWHDRVRASLAPEDWTSLTALLRHNHLATSSNVVCRTQFLVDLAPSFEKLRYCLDWHLFLRASIQGSLRFVPDPLIGYRLHGSNTVWFDDDARPGYVHEVNAVVADALRLHATTRRAAGVSGDAIAEEIAGLLREHVLLHGETDGLALYLAEATAGFGATPASHKTPQLAMLAQDALAAKRGPTTTDGDAVRTALTRHILAALSQRIRQVEPQLLQRKSESEEQSLRSQDLADMLRTTHAAEARAAASEQAATEIGEEKERLEAGLADANTRIEGLASDVRAARSEIESTRQILDATRTQLADSIAKGEARADETSRLAQALERARASADESAQAAAARRKLDEETLRATAAELERTRAEAQSLQRELELRVRENREVREAASALQRDFDLRVRESREAAAAAQAEHERLLQQEQEAARQAASSTDEAFRRNFAENALWQGRALAEEREARRRVESSFEHRVGRLLVDKLKLGKLLSPAMQLSAFASASLRRSLCGARKQLPGRQAARAVLVWDGAFPDADSAAAATFATALSHADIDVRVACAARGSRHWLTPDMALLAGRRMVVTGSRLLARRDRKWWQRRAAAIADAVLSFPVDAGLRARAFTLARNARATGAAYIHGFGLNGSGFLAFAAGQLMHAPYGLTLTRSDLPRVSQPGWRDALLHAKAVLVDSEALASHVRLAANDALPALVVCPPTAPARSAQAEPLPARIACIGPFDDSEGLLTLAGALGRLVRGGMQVQLDVLGADSGGAANLVAFDWFRGRLVTLGIADRVLFRPDASAPAILRAVGEASIVVDVRTGSDRDPAGISLGGVAALSSGRALIGFREGIGAQVADGKAALLSARGDEAGLADSIARLLNDSDTRRALGAGGQHCYSKFFAAGPACAEACARLRSLLRSVRA